MCTLSWQISELGDAHEIYFSRDEQRKRVKAEPPELKLINGVQCLLPFDPAGGGTWMGVNEYGVTICLLNDYRVSYEYPKGITLRSRGLLVRDLLGEITEPVSFHQRVREVVEAENYAPFRLVVFTAGHCWCWCWDGLRMNIIEDPSCPITSSSWDSERVENGRKKIYADAIVDEDFSQGGFHRHQLEGDAESSVCMSREFTQTVSLTRVKISDAAGLINIWYGDRIGENSGDDAFDMQPGGELKLVSREG